MNPAGERVVQRTEKDRAESMGRYHLEQRPLPAFMCEGTGVPTDPATLAREVIAGVMRNAQTGELPLFAWTFGLPQSELLDAVAQYFPELGSLEPMSEQKYAVILRTVPPRFYEMADLLTRHGAKHSMTRHVGWLAHAVAAAAMGERHLWQDLGLSNRGEVSRLLEHYFPVLHARNTRNLKWKRFLFGELGTVLGIEDLRPPGCRKCDHIAICFTQYKEHD